MINAAFLTDSNKRGICRYAEVGSKEQLADAFTKALPRDDFNRFRSCTFGWLRVFYACFTPAFYACFYACFFCSSFRDLDLE